MAGTPWYPRVLVVRRGYRRVRALWRRREVEVEALFLGVPDEIPVRGEALVIAVAELVEDDASHLADARRELQQLDEILCVEPARQRLAGSGQQSASRTCCSSAMQKRRRKTPSLH